MIKSFMLQVAQLVCLFRVAVGLSSGMHLNASTTEHSRMPVMSGASESYSGRCTLMEIRYLGFATVNTYWTFDKLEKLLLCGVHSGRSTSDQQIGVPNFYSVFSCK